MKYQYRDYVPARLFSCLRTNNVRRVWVYERRATCSWNIQHPNALMKNNPKYATCHNIKYKFNVDEYNVNHKWFHEAISEITIRRLHASKSHQWVQMQRSCWQRLRAHSVPIWNSPWDALIVPPSCFGWRRCAIISHIFRQKSPVSQYLTKIERWSYIVFSLSHEQNARHDFWDQIMICIDRQTDAFRSSGFHASPYSSGVTKVRGCSERPGCCSLSSPVLAYECVYTWHMPIFVRRIELNSILRRNVLT